MKRLATNFGKYLFGGIAAALLAGAALNDAAAQERRQRGWLGVTVQELTPSLRDAMKVGDRSGLLISSVVENSPADDAGLKEGDVIVRFDGNSVEKTKDFTRLVRRTSPGENVNVVYVRDGDEESTEVEIGRRKSSGSNYFSWSGGDDDNDRKIVRFFGRPRLGVQVHELNESLAGYFDADENGGVLILEVTEDSPAEKAGLKSGDVITKVDGEKVRDPEELIEILGDYDYDEVIEVEYLRKGSTGKVEVELESNNWHSSSGDFRSFGGPNVFFHRDLDGDSDFDIVIPEFEGLMRWQRHDNHHGNRIRIFDRLNRGNTI